MLVNASATVNVPTSATPPATSSRPQPRCRSVIQVIAGCLAAGATLALLLTLVVFAGATESTITGSLLLGCGLSWATITVLTSG